MSPAFSKFMACCFALMERPTSVLFVLLTERNPEVFTFVKKVKSERSAQHWFCREPSERQCVL